LRWLCHLRRENGRRRRPVRKGTCCESSSPPVIIFNVGPRFARRTLEPVTSPPKHHHHPTPTTPTLSTFAIGCVPFPALVSCSSFQMWRGNRQFCAAGAHQLNRFLALLARPWSVFLGERVRQIQVTGDTEKE
jgi:hypothetical protein